MRTKNVRLTAEELEAKLAPAAFTWNSAGAANWTAAAAWLENGNPTTNVPGTTDDVVFPVGQGACTVPANSNISVSSLSVDADTDQQINVNGTLIVTNANAVNSGKFVTGTDGSLIFDSGTFYSSAGHETYFDFSQGTGSFGGTGSTVYFNSGDYKFKGQVFFNGANYYFGTYFGGDISFLGQGSTDELIFISNDVPPVIATVVNDITMNVSGLDKSLKVLGSADSQLWVYTRGHAGRERGRRLRGRGHGPHRQYRRHPRHQRGLRGHE